MGMLEQLFLTSKFTQDRSEILYATWGSFDGRPQPAVTTSTGLVPVKYFETLNLRAYSSCDKTFT